MEEEPPLCLSKEALSIVTNRLCTDASDKATELANNLNTAQAHLKAAVLKQMIAMNSVKVYENEIEDVKAEQKEKKRLFKQLVDKSKTVSEEAADARTLAEVWEQRAEKDKADAEALKTQAAVHQAEADAATQNAVDTKEHASANRGKARVSTLKAEELKCQVKAAEDLYNASSDLLRTALDASTTAERDLNTVDTDVQDLTVALDSAKKKAETAKEYAETLKRAAANLLVVTSLFLDLTPDQDWKRQRN